MFRAVCLIIILIGETLHYIPGLEPLNAFGFECAPLQWGIFAIGAVVAVTLTLVSLRTSIRRFENTDL